MTQKALTVFCHFPDLALGQVHGSKLFLYVLLPGFLSLTRCLFASEVEKKLFLASSLKKMFRLVTKWTFAFFRLLFFSVCIFVMLECFSMSYRTSYVKVIFFSWTFFQLIYFLNLCLTFPALTIYLHRSFVAVFVCRLLKTSHCRPIFFFLYYLISIKLNQHWNGRLNYFSLRLSLHLSSICVS